MPNIKVEDSIQAIFDEFQNNIFDPSYYPKTPITTLKSRLTAVHFLANEDIKIAEKAADFIKRTSTNKEEDLRRLKALAAEITEWRSFEICSVDMNSFGPSVEYKVGLRTEQGEKDIHFHARYRMDKEQCCYVSQVPPLIRIIGDPVLHRPGTLFPANPSKDELAELQRQIEIAKSILIETSGAGIAGNQCAMIEDPYKFAIVGIFKDNESHIQGVARRYPGVLFPEAMVMVNPKIVSQSTTMQKFKHACLSVPSPNRCEVQSPEKITVAYLDPMQNMMPCQKTLIGIDAVVLWHEMNHINDGNTYIDTAIASLNSKDLAKFEQIIASELIRRRTDSVIPELTVPPFYFTITFNKHGKVQLDQATLADVLPKMTLETLEGLLKQCLVLRAESKQGIEAPRRSGIFAHHQSSENKAPLEAPLRSKL